jgi:hypothetical protein
MTPRKWHMSRALASVRALDSVVHELTIEEVQAALDLEAASQRRRSVIDRLIKRAMSLTLSRLQEKYHGTHR